MLTIMYKVRLSLSFSSKFQRSFFIQSYHDVGILCERCSNALCGAKILLNYSKLVPFIGAPFETCIHVILFSSQSVYDPVS
jgi:hypothetical protein